MSQIWLRIVFVIYIHKSIWILKCIQIFEDNLIPGYCCFLVVWRLLVRYWNLFFFLLYTENKVKYFIPPFLFSTIIGNLEFSKYGFSKHIQLQILFIILVYYEYKYFETISFFFYILIQKWMIFVRNIHEYIQIFVTLCSTQLFFHIYKSLWDIMF